MPTLKLAIIGGSGLAHLLPTENTTAHSLTTPFGPPAAPILETQISGLPVFLLQRHGPGHIFNPSQVPYRANIYALKQLGVTHIIATGAVGSLRDEIKPRHLLLCDQFIDKTSKRDNTFFDHAAVHVDFADPTDPTLRTYLTDAAKLLPDITLHPRGTYVCMEGPAFSTRAESLMHRLWGGDVIGMTALPEARLAREAEIAYALVALATDYDAWKPHTPPPDGTPPQDLITEILANLTQASHNAMLLIQKTIEAIAANPAALQTSPAHGALNTAIWTKKSAVPKEEIDRLTHLWIRQFFS
jgi:5'-methylthioadenosine phosphorylase